MLDRDGFLEEARRLLSLVISMAGLSRYEVDQRLGRARGYTGQVLSGRISLSLEFVRDVIAAAGIDPEVYFRLLFRSDERGKIGAEEIMTALEEKRLAAQRLDEPALASSRPATISEIEELLERKLAPLRLDEPDDPPPGDV